MSPYPHLLSPVSLGPFELTNRVIMGSMHTGLEELGDWPRVAAYFAARARGGVGLCITGGMAPNEEGGVLPGAAGLFGPQDIANHRFVTDRVHEEGGRIAMQILHAGRYAYTPKSVAPSALRAPISPFTPQALDAMGIEKQIQDIATSAARARDAGYDGVEIMGSEGYLINQFLVTHTNQREDEWGGSYENRMRFALEVVRRCRQVVGEDFLLIYRLSMIDLVPNGSSWEEVRLLAKEVEAAGANVINTGIGWHEARVPTIATSVPRGAFAWVTQKLMGEVSLPLITSNRINTAGKAEEILASGAADLVSMARPFLADPEFIAKAARGETALITPCIACNQACLDHTFQMKLTSCLVNPRACAEELRPMRPAAVGERIAVVGAGPAGINAALTLSMRGHAVVLFERSARIGGQLNMAARIPGKEEFKGLLAHYDAALAASRVDLRLDTEAQPGELAAFDQVILATGVAPRDPEVPMEAGAHVMSYYDLLNGAPVSGKRVAIIGAGGIGFDVAEYLTQEPDQSLADWQAEWGIGDPAEHRGGLRAAAPEPAERQVVLMQRKAEKPGKRLGKTTGWIHRAALKAKGVKMLSGVTYQRFTAEGVWIEKEGSEALIEADQIVLCAGQTPYRPLEAALKALAPDLPIHVIGGADVAAELDAKRAIDQAVALADRL